MSFWDPHFTRNFKSFTWKYIDSGPLSLRISNASLIISWTMLVQVTKDDLP